MPHARPRLAMELLQKRLQFTPIVAIQGARQTGKSFLARELLAKHRAQCVYVTLDDLGHRTLAQNSPQTFLSSFGDRGSLLIIDEAQKAPALFDAIKQRVDENRRPGQFLLLGSTEFSLLQNIRESMTGRMARIRLFPMTFSETHNLQHIKSSRAETLKYLECGGMPGVAFVRDSTVRSEFIQDFVDLTCQRDLHQFKRLKLDSELALAILSHTALLEEPTAASLCRVTRANPKKVATHLKALSELFILQRLDPHPSGTGKSIYLPFDSGVAAHLGATLERRLQIALLNERLTRNLYFEDRRHSFFYYRSTGKKIIHLVEQELGGRTTAFQIFNREEIKKPDLELLKAFQKKNLRSKAHLLAPVTSPWKEGRLFITPWEATFESTR